MFFCESQAFKNVNAFVNYSWPGSLVTELTCSAPVSQYVRAKQWPLGITFKNSLFMQVDGGDYSKYKYYIYTWIKLPQNTEI